MRSNQAQTTKPSTKVWWHIDLQTSKYFSFNTTAEYFPILARPIQGPQLAESKLYQTVKIQHWVSGARCIYHSQYYFILPDSSLKTPPNTLSCRRINYFHTDIARSRVAVV
jgi:hypothetical protein